MSKQYVIVVESNDNGVESVHGAYSVDGVTQAQAAIRRDLSHAGRSDEAVVIVPMTAPDEAIPSRSTAEAERGLGRMLDDVFLRYDALVLLEQTTLALLYVEAEQTADYSRADELRESLSEQKAELADALVSLLRKGIIDWTEHEEVMTSERYLHLSSLVGEDDAESNNPPVIDARCRGPVCKELNEGRTDAWRERKLHDIGRSIAEEFKSEES